MTQVERLEAAGLCNASAFSEKEKKALNDLSDQEVDQLISLHRKLGKAESDAARPFFPL